MLGHAGFVAAVSRCQLVELVITPVLLMLISLLPARARDDAYLAGAASSEGAGVAVADAV